MLFLIYEIFRLLIFYFLSEKKKHMSFDHVVCVTVTVDQLLALNLTEIH